MLNLSALRPTQPPEYNLTDLAAVFVVAAAVFGWAWVGGGSFSIIALLSCQAVFLVFYLVGTLVSGCRRVSAGVIFDLPLRLLVGYAIFNTALFVLAWLSPLGILADFGILVLVLIGLWIWVRPVRRRKSDALASYWVVGIALVAATLWCQDSIHAITVNSGSVMFEPWADTFYHSVHIRMFGASHGSSTIEDFRLAGVSARLYHYAPYLTPAVIKQVSGITAYTACTTILVPMGVFLTGLGAYVLVASRWGRWPGVLACAALLLTPDAAQQWIGNPFLSYHWITQISPGALFGLALLSLAWLFIITGCLRGSPWQIAVGWFFGDTVIFYKAQFFIASAVLLFIIPILFIRRRRPLRYRGWAALAAFAIYATAIALTQDVRGLPLIRFDGSSTGRMLNLINGFNKHGPFREFMFKQVGSPQPWIPNVAFGTPYLFAMSLGFFLPVTMFLLIRYRRAMPRLQLLFPVLIATNFLLMALGLAFDDRHIGSSEELPHRPFMLMYFMVVAWTGGAIGWGWLRSSRRPLRTLSRMVLLTILLLGVPAYFGSGVQRMWGLPAVSHLRVPTGLYRSAEYIRTHGKPNDVFQDSSFDHFYLAAAITECRPFVERMLVYVSQYANIVEQRAAVVSDFMQQRDTATIYATAKKLGIRWFLLHPGHLVAWPFANAPVFEATGFRVYRFD
jgi:hypothetical protein